MTITLLTSASIFTSLPPRVAFFFYSYAHHPDLHSFPTRRSSDLGDPCLLADHLADLLPHRRLGDEVEVGVGILDRKSTRLNSSHLGISYAVFCLKKKNGKMCIRT